MLLNTDFYTPQILSQYARSAALNLPANQFLLRRWLPDRFIDDLTYRFVKGGDTLISAASFRAFDAESSIASRPGISRVSGELPPISRKIVLGEYDQLRRRANSDPAVQSAILEDVDRLVRNIAARLEIARADAMVNGGVTIAENGVKASVSFGRSGSMAQTAATLWSSTGTADPLADMRGWYQAYLDINGQPPAVFLTSTRVQGLMLQNLALRSLLGNLAGTPTLLNTEQLGQIMQANGLPPILTYDARFRNAAGVSTRVIADNVALFLPEPVSETSPDGTDLGATFFGTTAESLDPTFGLAGDEAGIVAGSYRTEDPIALWTKAAAIALPVMPNPDLSMRLVVAS